MAERRKDESPEERVQETVNQEQEQGYRGTKVDPTPNEAYTVQGVTSGQPTPETDPALAREAAAEAGIGPEAKAKQQEEGK